MQQRSQSGFTLVELLVVVFIIGLLASVVTISASSARAQSRDAKRKSDLQLVASALELYYAQERSYPAATAAWEWSSLRTTLVPTYASSVPSDPLASRPDGDFSSGGYVYRTDSANGKFVLDATLERDDEPETITGTFAPDNPADPSFFQSGTYPYNGEVHYRVSGQ
ncbi:type II secretion system protein [Candidatus Berkelbacteria bacterium]|nr:type II secretion system protein [Candidatus Berkelbacteria bacterium]